jgi:hypothetical protein
VCLIIKILRIWTTSSSALIGKIYSLRSEKSVEPVVQLRFANNQKIASTLAVSWCSMKILHLYLGKHQTNQQEIVDLGCRRTASGDVAGGGVLAGARGNHEVPFVRILGM